jgi:hypothetical protein
MDSHSSIPYLPVFLILSKPLGGSTKKKAELRINPNPSAELEGC